MLIQTVVTGIAIGGIYALMAVGYSLIFSILNFSNFAYGPIIMLCSFFGYFGLGILKLPFWLVLILSMLVGAFLCCLSEILAYRPLRKRKAKTLYFMISAMGISILLENMVYATVGAHFYNYPQILQGTVKLLAADIGVLDLFAIIFSCIAIGALHFFINHSKPGIAIRAVSYDTVVSQINGININAIVILVFCLAGMMAGIAGMFLGMKYMAYPTMGWITNKAYISAVIGGMGSLPGAVVGAIILGLVESLSSVYISSAIRDVFSFSFLIIMLFIKPSGLFGKTLEEKV
ncbi:MAG: branched-chain amino acid ABC transporter permease [Oscillospiraceae bacterium]|nr:branched-chain amino acid ABC transporter permease [Oscillospiraceae bacterium]